MDTLQEISKNGVPDGFWIALTLILFGVLIWIVQRYLDNIASTFKELKDNIKKLTEIVIIHEKDIASNTKDIADNSAEIKDLQKSIANRRK